jgi:hypothetical protein
VLRIGLFNDFRSRTTLLLSGDDSDLSQLARMFRDLATGHQQRAALGPLLIAETGRLLRLQAVVVSGRTPIVRKSFQVYHWNAEAETWRQTADLVDALLQSGTSGHQYAGDDGEWSVVISKGEYDDGWWAGVGLR